MVTFLQITGCGSGLHCVIPPFITGQPANQIVSAGESALFTVAATASGVSSYQWLKNGQPIPSATQAIYLTPIVVAGDSGAVFKVTISNYLGKLTSASASLTVLNPVSGEVHFVAPTGNDSGAGTLEKPYKTIQHCASSISSGGACNIRAGTYRETITPNSNTTIKSYQSESVIVDGSDPVQGWTLDHGSVYKARVTLDVDDTNQVFVGHEMMTEARWPNGDDLFHVHWANAKAGTDVSHIFDPKLPALNWTGAKIHLWSGSDPFGHQTGKVISSAAGRLGIDVGQAGTCPYICPAPDGFYYLFGTLEALDTEREWFYDLNETTLYFIAPGNVDPNNIDIRAKRRPYAFDLRGKIGVTLSGIAIFGATIITDAQSLHNTLDHINAQYVSQFTDLTPAADDPTGQRFSFLQIHRTDAGIIIDGTANIVQNSTVTFSAGNGIALEGNGNTLTNNLIQNVDYVGNYGSGISLDGDGNTVRFNSITNVGRQAIHVTGVRNEDISYNNLSNAMMLSRDGGEVYACCNQTALGTRIHHNWLHDTVSQIAGQGDSLSLSGVAIDNGSSGFEVDQNVIWNNQNYNVLINGVSGTGLNNNHIFNNTIPDASPLGQMGVIYVPNCTSTRLIDNKIVVSIQESSNGSACTLDNNNSTAPGATEMTFSTQVGCNFAGCSSSPPPVVSNSGSLTPCPVNGQLWEK
jgi:hypothetical protein